MKRPKTHDPLGPLDFVTSFFATLLGVLILLVTASAIFGWGGSTLGMGGESVCVTTDLRTFGLTEDPYGDVRKEDGIHRKVSIDPDGTQLCDGDPGLRQHASSGLTQAPSAIVFFAFVLLTRRIIRYARRHGLFSVELAQRITRLGWLLLAGLLMAGFLKWLGEGLLLSSMVDSMSWTDGSIGVSVPALIGAVGVVSIGRIMIRAAALQADSDATI
ncbi:hypothetical protein GCM10022234_19950 [Aeromicrobium panaciterrae]